MAALQEMQRKSLSHLKFTGTLTTPQKRAMGMLTREQWISRKLGINNFSMNAESGFASFRGAARTFARSRPMKIGATVGLGLTAFNSGRSAMSSLQSGDTGGFLTSGAVAAGTGYAAYQIYTKGLVDNVLESHLMTGIDKLKTSWSKYIVPKVARAVR